HGDVCLSWGRWGEFVGGRGSGGDGLESGGSGVMEDGGKIAVLAVLKLERLKADRARDE
nr:hypothetical protein [Tanacetum cinerariifolium]